jgi:hypothetical protein
MWQRRSTIPLSLMLGLAAVPAAAQVEVTVHGGLHLDLASGARYGLERPERPRSARRWAGEATTAGTRVAVELSRGWQLDGGVAWSRSSNWEGAVSRTIPSFEAQAMFFSSTVQGWLTEPDARVGVVAGLGPAVIVQRSHGAADAHQTNVGGLLTFAGVVRLDRRFSVRLDAQQYLFSSAFDDPYTPHLGTAPMPAHATSLRHDFVVLAGFSWRSE